MGLSTLGQSGYVLTARKSLKQRTQADDAAIMVYKCAMWYAHIPELMLPQPVTGWLFFPPSALTSLSRRAVQRRVPWRRLMHLTTPSDLARLAQRFTQARQRDLTESRTRSQQICEAATAACAGAADIRHEAVQLRQHARQLRAVHAQHLIAGGCRRQDALTPGSCPVSAADIASVPQMLKESLLPHEGLPACHPQQR
jgi:hypothetical protein